MTVAHSVRAIYQDGWLKPLEPLALSDRQQVDITISVLEAPTYTISREAIRHLHEKANTWLAQQPITAVQEPRVYSRDEQARLDAEFDRLLTAIQTASEINHEADLADLVDEAVTAVRASHG